MPSNHPHRVVIVGGGFGGLRAARALRNAPAEVTLVDRENYHLFQPLLYQVATGGLSATDIASPLRWIVRRQRNTSVARAEVTGIDVANSAVLLDGGRLSYDTLVAAAGAGQSYFGNDQWQRFAPGLKTLESAAHIRRRVLGAFEAAEREDDPGKRRAWLTFVIVGAGPTGVELAGALGELSRDSLTGDFRHIDPAESAIHLVEYAPRVLTAFPPDLSAEAERSLIRLGVRPRTGVKVVSIDELGVDIETGGQTSRIDSRTVLWAAGVEASPLGRAIAEQTGASLDRAGRITVQADCTVPGHPEIFIIGDMARFPGPNGEPLPGVAPVAMQQGTYVGRLIAKRLRGETGAAFRYRDKGNLATIGRNRAVADFGRIRIHGFFAWVTWLFVHLLYLVGFQNRVLVAIQWAFHYFTYNRKARLIVGDGPRVGDGRIP